MAELWFKMFRVDRIEDMGSINEVEGQDVVDASLREWVALDAERLLFLAGRQDHAIDEDVDEQPVQDLALNVDNVFQADDYDAFDSDDAICAHHEEHAMHDNVQLNHTVDSHVDYLSDSNMILYDQYVKDNAVPVVHSNEETLKKELHSIKLQLASTINHNKLMVEEVTSLKKDFKQKENKYLEDFLEMKSLKEKVEDRLFKQDQSLQIVQMLCRPKPYYNELNKVAIGYKNPLCLTHAKQVQPAHEIIKDNHVPAIVHNTKDTLEIAEITRRKINDKMKDPESTFTPQKQLTPEQIFWSQDLIKLKSKALKEQTTVSRPIKALTMYPLNTPRITPTGLTERERGFEQTHECYLKEVIPYFKMVKENFEGIQKALTKEIKEMKDVFEELEAQAHCLELEAELSNLRAKSHNDNHDELVNRFSKLEVNRLNLQLKYQNLKDGFRNNPPTPDKDTPDFDSVFMIGKMKASLKGKDNVIRQLKKQISHLQETRSDTDRTLKHYKEFYDSIKITCAKHIEQVTALKTKNVNLKAQILDKGNSVSKDHVKPKVLAPGKYAIYVEPIVPQLRNNREAHLDYLKHHKESVKTIRDIVEEAKKTNVPVPPSTGVNSCTNASGSQPRRNTKKNRISPAKGVNKMQVEEQSRTNKSHLRTMNRVNSSIRFGNDHFGAIMGYGDYVIGDSIISRVYYVEGLGHNLFSVRQFCDSNLEVAFKKHSCYVRDTDAKILENYNQQLILEYSLVIHQAGNVIESITSEPDESWKPFTFNSMS
nr:integrase, catalytic region, zinc finger, CCHC-type, peptidase aspartic, catalytic [Tanacetum cinerariifolium]